VGPMRGWWSTLALVAACAPPPAAPPHRGTFEPGRWPAMELRSGHSARGLVARVGEVTVLEGDDTLVSGAEGQYGLRFDDARNDLASVVARLAQEGLDRPASLVLFTTFEDHGGGGPAYFVPIQSATAGTGLGPVDQGALFGAAALKGVANMKRRAGHLAEDLEPLLVHEIAHRHLAYLSAAPAAGSTVAPTLLGRQQAHWHAALDTQGSVLGGHGFVEASPGRFTVARVNDALSDLDLYGLGLLRAEEVQPTFRILDPRTEAGFSVPAEAQLAVGDVILGTREVITAAQVVAALGPRDPRDDPEARVVFALLTAPGELAAEAQAEAEAVEAVRVRLEAAWPTWTRGRGRLCTTVAGCAAPVADGGITDAAASDAGVERPAPDGCRAGPGGELGVLLLAGLGRRRRRRGP
jgi:hypothetical protein